jgi:hypothetical protein
MKAEETNDEASLDLVRRFVAGYAPSPLCVLLAGSRGRGTAKKNSDYDLVFLYAELPLGAWREMTSCEGADLEIFAHDLRSLQYFLSEIERPSGEASLACMVSEGISALGANSVIENEAKVIAREFLASGPLPLDDVRKSQRRYAITDLAEMLKCADSASQWIAIGSALYPALGGFVLSANGRWTASGKALPAALRDFSSSLELEFTDAFEQLYKRGNDSLLQKLVDDILKPFGGRLRGGFRQQAPASWR